MTNLKVTGANRVVLVNTNLPDSAQEQLVQLPGMIMTQFAMNAVLGGSKGDTTSDGDAASSDDSPGNDSGDDPASEDAPGEKPETDEKADE
jgi:hypothetical protein